MTSFCFHQWVTSYLFRPLFIGDKPAGFSESRVFSHLFANVQVFRLSYHCYFDQSQKVWQRRPATVVTIQSNRWRHFRVKLLLWGRKKTEKYCTVWWLQFMLPCSLRITFLINLLLTCEKLRSQSCLIVNYLSKIRKVRTPNVLECLTIILINFFYHTASLG